MASVSRARPSLWGLVTDSGNKISQEKRLYKEDA